MALEDFLNLHITIEDKAPTQASFGTPLILAFHEAWTDTLVKEYADASELLDDGIDEDDDVYKLAVTVKSQEPSPSTFKVGRRPFRRTVTLDPTTHTATGNVLSVTLDGVVVSHTVLIGENGNKTAVVEALAAAAALALGDEYTVTENNDKVTVEAPDSVAIAISGASNLVTATLIVDPPLQKIRYYPTKVSTGAKYEGSVGGTDYTYTVASGDAGDLEDICTAFAAKLATDLGAVDVTVTSTATYVELATDTAGVLLEHIVSAKTQKILRIKDFTADTTMAAHLNAVLEEDSDWYCLLLVGQSAASIQAAAAVIETQKKIFSANSADWDLLVANETGDIATTLKNLSYARTFLIYHSQIAGEEGWLAGGWLSQRLTDDPGSDTWAFKTVKGASPTKLKAGQRNALKGKNCSFYVTEGGLNVTFDGKSPSGRYGDTVRGIDWLYARSLEALFGVIAQAKKVPYTDAGVDIVVGALQAVFNLAAAPGLLLSNNPAPVISAPKVKDVPNAKRINRILPDLKGKAQLAGAIHGVDPIDITVSV